MPLLNALEIPFEVWTTTGVNDAGRIGREILAQAGPGAGERKVTVVVAAGDGTAHELMDGVFGAGGEIGKWEIAVLPMGTVSHPNSRRRWSCTLLSAPTVALFPDLHR